MGINEETGVRSEKKAAHVFIVVCLFSFDVRCSMFDVGRSSFEILRLLIHLFPGGIVGDKNRHGL